MQLDKPVEFTSGGNPLLIHKILHLLFFPLVQILCAQPQFKLILGSHLPHHLPAPFCLKIESTTQKCLIASEPHSYKAFAPILVFLLQIDQL
jgi:hypothetical protein